MTFGRALLLSWTALAVSDLAIGQEDPKDIVAAAVRATGHTCEQPKSVAPDPQDTSPDEKAWILQCETNTYWVKFKGDASVEVQLRNN